MPPLDREFYTLQAITTTTTQLTTMTGRLRLQLSKGFTKVITKVIDHSLLLNHVPGTTYLSTYVSLYLLSWSFAGCRRRT